MPSLTACGAFQTSESARRYRAGIEIGHVTLRVSDVERSAEFYAGLVGLRPTEISSDRAMLADPADPGRTRLELVRAEQPGQAPVRAAGLFHVAFLYPSRAGLGAALQRMTDGGGYELTGASDHGVSEALYLQDPDGLGIELYRDRPRDQWPRANGRIEMFSEPLALAPIAAAAAEGSAEETAAGVCVGHVHLRSGDLERTKSFWTGEIGLEVTVEGPTAVFMAAGSYHHHIGANTWQSHGAEPAPRSGPGLEAIVLDGAGPARELTSPEGIRLAVR